MLWKGFQKPKRLEVELETLTATYGKFSAQPFERGFGATIGNAMRRILLSSIEGVLHEFSSIPGVVEDTTDIILNLKQVPFRIHSDHQETLTLVAEGARTARSGDIQASANVVSEDSRASAFSAYSGFSAFPARKRETARLINLQSAAKKKGIHGSVISGSTDAANRIDRAARAP